VHEFSRQLELEDLISLYAISKDFHVHVDARFTATILSQSLDKAPESSRIFLFKCYHCLYMPDPASRPNEEIPTAIRSVPSFRWLRMVLFREQVVAQIIRLLAYEGHHLPRGTSSAIKKIWFTLDVADNARRISLFHNAAFWTNRDLVLATMFLFKLDMRFTHPVNGAGETHLRNMMMAQRTLTVLRDVLQRKRMRTRLEMMRMYVLWRWIPRPANRHMTVLSVPPEKQGRLQYEGWGAGSQLLLRPDELLLRESVRRQLPHLERFFDLALWGHIDDETFEDVQPPPVLEEDDLSEWEDKKDGGDEEAKLKKREARRKKYMHVRGTFDV
jgi:hypothetical protein